MQVFLSYNHKDRALAHRVAQALQAFDLQVWLDEQQIKPGVEIAHAIQHAIGSADAIVFLVSREWASSHYASLEMAAAVARDVRNEPLRIVPVLIDKGARPPSLLAGYAYLDLSDRQLSNERVAVLVDALLGERLEPASEEVRSAQRSELSGTAVALERAQVVERERVMARERTLRTVLYLTLLLSTISGALIALTSRGLEIAVAVSAPLVALIAAVIGFYYGQDRC